jgi:hypothetical protein
MNSEVPSLRSLLAKDKDIIIIFIQNNLLVSCPYLLPRPKKALSSYQTHDSLVKVFFQ